MMDVGTAVHSAFLLGEDIIAEFPFDSWRSDAAKARRSAALAAGKIPLLSERANTDARRGAAALPVPQKDRRVHPRQGGADGDLA